MAELSPAVQAALTKVERGRKEHQSRTTRYDRAYDIYRASEPRARGVMPWQSKLRVPYGRQVIDTEVVNIVSGQPRVVVRPRHPDNEFGAKAMQYVLDYYVGEDHLVEKQPVFVQQGVIYGATAAKNHWLYREANKTIWVQNAQGTREAQQAKIISRDGPTFEPWNIYHVFWEPGARDVDSAAYVVLQSYLSKDDLLKLAYNEDRGDGLYHNVEDLIRSGQGQTPTDTAQQRALGLGPDRYKDKFLIEEIWTDDTLVVLGNGQVLLRAQENPYWHGRKPVVVAQPMPDGFEMLGIPDTEAVDHLQQALWTVQNMRMDNLHLTVMRGITYREGGVTDPNLLELRPRFKWPVSDHDDIRPFEVQPLPSEAYSEENALLGRLQLITGVNSYISGSDTQGVDQNTATGVTALQEVASRLLRFKAAQIHYKGYQRSFEMWGDMAQQFLDRNVAVKIVGPGGQAQWVDVKPEDIAGHYDYVLEGSEESLSRQQERGEAIALLNAFAPLAPLGVVNLKPILEKVAVAYGFTNPESLLAAPAPPQAQAAPVQQQLPQQPKQPSLLGGQTLDPRIANAITSGR